MKMKMVDDNVGVWNQCLNMYFLFEKKYDIGIED